MTIKPIYISLLLTAFFWMGCVETPPTPKPRTYPKINFPEKSYEVFDHPNCPYKFEIPVYGQVEKDSIFFGEKAPNDCWINVLYPDLNGQLYCSYYAVKSPEQLEALIIDRYRVASKHTIKADYIDEYIIDLDQGVYGMAFEIEGPAASGFQFFLTDSLDHYFKASLYLNAKVVPDSMAPIVEFLKADVYHMIETFEWQERNQ